MRTIVSSRMIDRVAAELGTAMYARMDAPATPAQKQVLKRLSSEQVRLTDLAGEPVQRVLTHAFGNGAPIDGVKVEAESAEAQAVVDDALLEFKGNEDRRP